MAEGRRTLSLFHVPRTLKDGSQNACRMLRLKSKMGTRSLATGEIRFEGALAYLIGGRRARAALGMDQINLSRLSHRVRASAMMPRGLNEAMAVARHREAFSKNLIGNPLMCRKLLKIMLPAEQALSAYLFTAHMMERADNDDQAAAKTCAS